jgi:PAS domain S-box-containing protein
MADIEVPAPASAAVPSTEELVRRIAELRQRRRDLLEPREPHTREVLAAIEATDRSLDETVAEIISNQASALRESTERLHLAVEASDLGIWEYDPATGDRRWSRRCKELFGFPTDDDSVVTQERFISTLHPDDRPRWYSVVRDAMDPGGERRYRIEYRIRRPSDGQERWISATGRTQFVADRPVRMVGTLLDVSERRRAEEERDLFLGMLGHDLRGPLSTIVIGSDLLALERAPEIAGTATRIASNARRMQRMIEDLLDFARARAGHLELHRQAMDLAELCREAVHDLAVANPQQALEVEADAAVCGRWDRDRLRQAVENLVSNALTHGRPDRPVRVSVRSEADGAHVDVCNEGEPIPDEIRSSLFEAFRRGTKKGRGLGLGLYIARQIVTTHGGSISVDSNDQATTFSIRLPNQ